MSPLPSVPRQGTRGLSSQTLRTPNRGGIRKRNAGPLRVDKDGDLEMNDGEIRSKGRGGGRGGRGGRGGSERQDSGLSTVANNTRAKRRTARVPQALKDHLNGDRYIPPGPRRDARDSRLGSNYVPKEHELPQAPRLAQIIVRGFRGNEFEFKSGDLDRLIYFLEHNVSPGRTSTRSMVRIRKVCLTLCFPGRGWHCSFGLSGLLSFQAKLSERRPRYSSLATTTYGSLATSRFISLANVV